METNRIKKLQENMKNNRDIPFLLTDLSNIFYLTGFTGSSGFLIVFPDRPPVFLCDGRYTTQAKKEFITSTEIVEFNTDVYKRIADILTSSGFRTVYFETSLSYQSYLNLKEKNLELVPVPNWLEEMRMIKSPRELELIERALHLSEKAWEAVSPMIRPGIKEKDFALELDYQMIKAGGDSIAFSTIVASGERSALPHAQPTDERMEAGSWLVVDWGVRYQKYCGDITRTVPVGCVEDLWFEETIQLLKEAQQMAQEFIRDGVRAADVERTVRNFLNQHKIEQYFTHSLGHGIGIQVHESPRLSNNSEVILRENMVVTVEPGVYIPGKGGIRLENIVVVEKESCRILNRLPVIL